MRKLIILSGVPGSGKSYFSNELRHAKENKHIYIVSSDAIRNLVCGIQSDMSQDKIVWDMFYELPKVYSKDPDGIVILDATNTKAKYRLETLEKLKEYFDEYILVSFNLPSEIVDTQNIEREFPVPSEAVKRMRSNFELPSKEEYEAFKHVFVIDSHRFDEIIKKI